MQRKFWLTDADIAERMGVSRVTPWRHSKAGLLPPPIRLSVGCTRWPAHEIEAIDRARLAGGDDEAIRVLVQRLVAERAQTTQREAA